MRDLGNIWAILKYLLCAKDVSTKYAWVKSLKYKKVKQFLMLLLK